MRTEALKWDMCGFMRHSQKGSMVEGLGCGPRRGAGDSKDWRSEAREAAAEEAVPVPVPELTG